MRGSALRGDRRAIRWIAALVLSLGLLSVAVATAVGDHARQRESLDRALSSEARRQADSLDNYFARARSLTQVTASNPAFRRFYELPGDRRDKVLAQGNSVREANSALSYLEHLFPGSIGEACFIDRSGPENARAVRGEIAPISELSPDETGAPFFEPTFDLRPGQVYQARPYLSPDTSSWVVSNSTPLAIPGRGTPAIVHFEISIESFRRAAAGERFDVAVVEARSGRVIVDSRFPQPPGEEAVLGRPMDRRFERLVSTAGRAFEAGSLDAGGLPAAFQAVQRSPHNANQWIVVALAKHPASSWIDDVGLTEVLMGGLALLLLGYAIMHLRSSHAQLRSAALTDSLTGIANRRSLVADLEAGLAGAHPERPFLLAMFDLDGFKSYNDTFGHPAGDALLVRLARRLNESMAGRGEAYRMGGDEFCVLAPLGDDGPDAAIVAAERALSEHGEGFSISCSYGAVVLPEEAADAGDALRLVDQRMYANKNARRASAGQQTTDVLVRVLAERYPELGEHVDGVVELTRLAATRLGLGGDDLAVIEQAAALHDLGKVAVPDAILDKPGPLNEEEWEFIRQHTLIGERILTVAPALAPAARLVRACHERVDGTGYPDGLQGDEIPLGARIIGVCDAFHAMTSSRPYRPAPLSVDAAIQQLREGEGTQFDARVVSAFVEALRERSLQGDSTVVTHA